MLDTISYDILENIEYISLIISKSEVETGIETDTLVEVITETLAITVVGTGTLNKAVVEDKVEAVIVDTKYFNLIR